MIHHMSLAETSRGIAAVSPKTMMLSSCIPVRSISKTIRLKREKLRHQEELDQLELKQDQWQQDAETFVCMEPWNGWANSVNEAGRHIELAPGASKTFAWSITIG